MQNTKISSAPVVFGDAEVTVYRIRKDTEQQQVSSTMHTHVYYECHVIMHGSASIRFEKRQIVIPKEGFVIIPPGTKHFACELMQDAENSDTDLVLGITLQSVKAEQLEDRGYYQAFSSALQNVSCCPLTLEEDLQALLMQFFFGMESGGFRKRGMQKVMAYQVVFSLLDAIGGFQTVSTVAADVIQTDKQSVELDWLVNSHVSLQEIAKEMGYTPRHTARLIRQRYALSLGEIWQMQRLNTAKKIVWQCPEASMQQIAIQSGFSSVDGMRRAFLKWEHMTPTEYRKIASCRKDET